MKKIKVGSNEIAYKDIGSGTPIVFLHGFCGSSSYWDKIVPSISEDFRVILIDLRGHGDSSSNVYPFMIDDMAKDIKEVIETLQLGQVYLFGHSLGGYVTLSLVEHFPEKVIGYGLIHSTAYPDSDEAKEGRVNAVQNIETNGIQPFIDGLVPKLFSDESFTNLKEEVANTIQIGYSTNSQAAKQTLLAMKSRPDRNVVLKNNLTPALLVAGNFDKLIPLEKVFSVNGEHIQTKIIHDAGHMSMYENPKALIETIKDFLLTEKK